MLFNYLLNVLDINISNIIKYINCFVEAISFLVAARKKLMELFPSLSKNSIVYKQLKPNAKYQIIFTLKLYYEIVKPIFITTSMMLLIEYISFWSTNENIIYKKYILLNIFILCAIYFYLLIVFNKYVSNRLLYISIIIGINILIIPIIITFLSPSQIISILLMGVLSIINWTVLDYIFYSTGYYKNYISKNSKRLVILKNVIIVLFILELVRLILFYENQTDIVIGICFVLYYIVYFFEYRANINNNNEEIDVEISIFTKKKSEPYITTKEIEYTKDSTVKITLQNNQKIYILEKDIKYIAFSNLYYFKKKKKIKGSCKYKKGEIFYFHHYRITKKWIHLYTINGKNYNVIVFPKSKAKKWEVIYFE